MENIAILFCLTFLKQIELFLTDPIQALAVYLIFSKTVCKPRGGGGAVIPFKCSSENSPGLGSEYYDLTIKISGVDIWSGGRACERFRVNFKRGEGGDKTGPGHHHYYLKDAHLFRVA